MPSRVLHTYAATLVSHLSRRCALRLQERTAVAVWLLSLVHRAGDLDGIQDSIPKLQAVFTRLLGERSQFTQEAAGKVCTLLL